MRLTQWLSFKIQKPRRPSALIHYGRLVVTVLGLMSPMTSFAKALDQGAIEQLTLNATIPQLQQAMNQKQLTAEDLVKFYLARIESENPKLNAVIALNPNAIKIAQSLDQERQQGKTRGPLHGIPVLLKDNIETLEMPTTAGSLALKDNHTKRDAPLVSQLREAGAIILGKTNLSEWANFRSTRSSSGWSGVGGQTRNPLDITRSTCGSSSGSGAAVAANLAVAAVGTETDGSIVCPSSATGIVGIKPTVGLISRRWIVPISHSQDTAGPMAKNITDAALLLAAMQSQDDQDTASTRHHFDFRQNYQTALSQIEMNGKKIGVLHSPALDHEGVRQLFDGFLAQLSQQKIQLFTDIKTHAYEQFHEDEFAVLMIEFKHSLNQYLAGLPNQLNQLTLEKLIQFNRENQQQEMPYFQQEIFEMSQAQVGIENDDYQKRLAKMGKATRQDGIDQIYQEHQLDLLISVTLGPTWKIDEINGDHYSGGVSTFPAVSGYPHLTLPLGYVHHLPIGLSLIGRATDEKKLIQFGYTFEKLLQDKSGASQ